jgi:hypothetical protein
MSITPLKFDCPNAVRASRLKQSHPQVKRLITSNNFLERITFPFLVLADQTFETERKGSR